MSVNINYGKTIVHWWLDMKPFGGNITAILDDAREMGATTIMVKVGDGIRPWKDQARLKKFVDEAHRQGFKVVGWWYLYGQTGEGIYMGQAARALGLDGMVMDVEGHFESHALDPEKMAVQIVDEYRLEAGEIPLGLCSWWKPSYHPRTPVMAFLQGCDFNMPQCYPIGDISPEANVLRVEWSLEEYAKLGYTGPTIPMCAAFTEGGWTATVAQINLVDEYVRERELPGIAWYARHSFQPGYKEAITAHPWPRLASPSGMSYEFRCMLRRMQRRLGWRR